MTPYKYGDIKISVTCDMTRDDEMEAAIAYMNAAKERLRAVKSNVVPKIEAVGEARFVAILDQLRGLAATMKEAGVDASIYADLGNQERVHLHPSGTVHWHPGYPMEYGTFFSCNIDSPLDALKTSDLFQMGIGTKGIVTHWNDKRVYELLRKDLLNKITTKANDANAKADHILAQYDAVIGGAK